MAAVGPVRQQTQWRRVSRPTKGSYRGRALLFDTVLESIRQCLFTTTPWPSLAQVCPVRNKRNHEKAPVREWPYKEHRLQAVQRIALPLSKALVSLLPIDPQSIIWSTYYVLGWASRAMSRIPSFSPTALVSCERAAPGRIAPCRSCPRPSPGGCAAKNYGQASAVAVQAFCTQPRDFDAFFFQYGFRRGLETPFARESRRAI